MTAQPPSPHDPAARSRVRWRRRGRRLVAALVALAGLALLAGAPVAWLVHARPGWWPEQRGDMEWALVRARGLENGVVTLLTDARPINGITGHSEPWAVSVRADDASAWLLARLPSWAAHQDRLGRWPSQIVETRARLDDGGVTLGVRVRPSGAAGDGSDQYLTARLEPSITADGALWLRAQTVSLGRLRVPASWMFADNGEAPSLAAGLVGAPERVPADLLARPEARRVARALAGLEPLLIEPVLDLHDGRRVRLLAVRIEIDRLVLTCQTEWRVTPP